MLAGPGGASRWVNEDIDALPYADELPEGWRADVDRLVQEEMRRMKKRPKDYLEEMPPAREIDWSGCPLLEKAFARVAEGKGGLDRPDGARYELAPPPKNKRNDEKAWEVAVKNARAQLEHQTLRVQNLELAAKFAPAAWRAHNAHLEMNISRYATRASAPPREERRDAPPPTTFAESEPSATRAGKATLNARRASRRRRSVSASSPRSLALTVAPLQSPRAPASPRPTPPPTPGTSAS